MYYRECSIAGGRAPYPYILYYHVSFIFLLKNPSLSTFSQQKEGKKKKEKKKNL